MASDLTNLGGVAGQSNMPADLINQTASNASSTTSVAYMDELIKEYLIYRGFNLTFKSFEQDSKQDRDRCFKAEKITDQLLAFIHSYDFVGLMDYWSFLEHKYFSRLTLRPFQNSSASLTRKYEVYLLRYYLVYSMQTSKTEKAIELLENLASKFKSQNEWKEWYCLPFLKNPEENPTFSLFFSKNWIDMFIISLQNFLNIVIQSLQSPKLLNYDEDLFWNRQQQFSASSNLSNSNKSGGTGSSSQINMVNNLLNAIYFEQDYLHNELTDEIQLIQPTHTQKQSSTFISMIKNIANSNSSSSSNRQQQHKQSQPATTPTSSSSSGVGLSNSSNTATINTKTGNFTTYN